MLQKFAGLLIFRIDPSLSADTRRELETLLVALRGAELKDFSLSYEEGSGKLVVDLVSESSLQSLQRQSGKVTICVKESNPGLFSFGQELDSPLADGIIDELKDARQLEFLLMPFLHSQIQLLEVNMLQSGMRNLRRLETATRALTVQLGEETKPLNPETLLSYAQQLVDLEKEMFQADELAKVEKIVKHFFKTGIGEGKVSLIPTQELWNIKAGRQVLPLPRFKGDFIALEMNWEEDGYLIFLKKVLFYHSLISSLQSRQDIPDPFYGERLWEGVLDSLPFPVALLSDAGEVYQHNSLFSKLNFPPLDCLELKLKEKVVIGDIPYNVFRKTVHHLDEEKYLFVFFTESFFLKGDGNHTPSGQELGIISSSIAHELNNPIAGIQAALTLLMLDEENSEEARQTLVEMKNGAIRCKQLIETFLGFSRATPRNLPVVDQRLGPVEICFQQAQNLLRFRTVESGIRFSLAFSRHAEFRSEINISLLTMTFYLILGELMTLYSHQLLVSNRNQIEKVIKGDIIESSQEIQIQLHELNISDLALSKLIQNLLKIENFVPQVTDYSLRFIYSPSRDA
jgi:hypothetical protein